MAGSAKGLCKLAQASGAIRSGHRVSLYGASPKVKLSYAGELPPRFVRIEGLKSGAALMRIAEGNEKLPFVSLERS
jgi:hypothetical protein